MRRNRSVVAIFALLLVLSNIGCHKQVTPHPNQLNAFDGQAYDALATAQATLDQAKAEYAAGKLPAASKQLINTAGVSYNACLAAWLTYRDVVQGKTAGDPAQAQQILLNDMNSLAAAILNLKNVIGGH